MTMSTNANVSLATANKIKLEEMIHRGATKAQAVIERIASDIPDDTLGLAPAFGFRSEGTRVLVDIRGGRDGMLVHQHALSQLAAVAGIPGRLLSAVDEPWEAEMAADVLGRCFRNRLPGDKRLLARHVRGEVRAVLSDSYKRFDSGVLLAAFCEAAQHVGLNPYDGVVSDTRFTIQTVGRELYEPIPGEVYVRGAAFGHSDFGDGALEIRGYLMRLACTNGMMARNHLRQVHLGRKMHDIVLSQETYRLQSQATAGEIKDIVRQVLDRKVVDLEFNAITKAYEQKIEGPKEADALVKRAAAALGSKELAEKARDAFNGLDVENMPAGNTMARWAQSISWVANAQTEARKRLDLQGYAAELMGVAPPGGGRTKVDTDLS